MTFLHPTFRNRPGGIIALSLLALTLGVRPVPAQEGTTVVYLVRHAETRLDEEGDRHLNFAGIERSHALANLLGEVGITRVYSTDFHRTRETAGPLAEARGLEVEIYDYRTLAEFAERLSTTPGRFLVAGHSNTTPQFVELLGGDPGEPIAEQYEFDRLYVVVLSPGNAPTTMLLRYGPPSGR